MIQVTRAENPVKNSFDLLLLDHSPKFYIRLQRETALEQFARLRRSVCTPTNLFFTFLSVSCSPQKLMLEYFISLPLPDPSMMMSEWRFSWGVVKVFCSSQ